MNINPVTRILKPGLVIVFLIGMLVSCSDQTTSVPLTLNDYPESNSEQVSLYISKCGECHAAPLPTMHTDNEWPGVVQRMQFRRTSKAMLELSAQELQIIVGYLQKHAKRNSGRN